MSDLGFMGSQQNKSMSSDLAERLWPQYQACGGNLSKVLTWAKAQKINISKPTLDRLAKNFGWKDKLSSVARNRFSAVVDTTGDLSSLLAEVVTRKNDAQKILETTPEDFAAHKLYGEYLGRILDIRKSIAQEKFLDRDQLLLDVLKEVVNYLVEHDQSQAVEFINENLEDLAYRVKEKCLSKAR